MCEYVCVCLSVCVCVSVCVWVCVGSGGCVCTGLSGGYGWMNIHMHAFVHLYECVCKLIQTYSYVWYVCVYICQ